MSARSWNCVYTSSKAKLLGGHSWVCCRKLRVKESCQPGGVEEDFFVCGKDWRKEGRWGFLACVGDEQAFQSDTGHLESYARQTLYQLRHIASHITFFF